MDMKRRENVRICIERNNLFYAGPRVERFDLRSLITKPLIIRLDEQSRLSPLKPGGRRSEKAGLEGRKDVCIVVQ